MAAEKSAVYRSVPSVYFGSVRFGSVRFGRDRFGSFGFVPGLFVYIFLSRLEGSGDKPIVESQIAELHRGGQLIAIMTRSRHPVL